MTWEHKAWGQVQHIFASDHAAVSCLCVLKGTRTSLHFHGFRHNVFSVMTGALVVETWPEWLKLEDFTNQHLADPDDRRVLFPGDTCEVMSPCLHRFRVLESGNAVEVYWANPGETVRLDDIQRFDEGGADDLSELRRLVGLAD